MSETLTLIRLTTTTHSNPESVSQQSFKTDKESVECEARLDTGASHCIFKRAHGELLGLDIESTAAENIGTVTGSFKARRRVIQTLMEMDCIPSGMELFPAADEEQWAFIKRIIDDCDYYLLIIGGRYGSTTAAQDTLTSSVRRPIVPLDSFAPAREGPPLACLLKPP